MKNRVGALYLSYGIKSDYFQNKISRVKKALVNLKKAIKFNQENYKALALLGRSYLTLGKWSKAIEYLVRSLELKKDEPFTICLISVAHAVGGNIKASYKILDKAMREYKKFSKISEFQVLLPVVRALICYNYEKYK